MTPREPDRYEAKANEICAERGIENAKTRRIFADALRAVEAETLERTAQGCAEKSRDYERRAAAQYEHGSADEAGYLAQRASAWRDAESLCRAPASPAAAPAAETKVCVCRYLDGAEFMGKCPAHPAPPSEPAAPAADLRAWRLVGPFRISAPAQGAEAPDLRRVVERAQVELDRRDARIAELEAALRELTRAATEHANAHGCSGDLGARLSDAKALLAAHTSQSGAGEGTT